MFSKAETRGGRLLHIFTKIGQRNYVAYDLGKSLEKMANASPQMIRLLESNRHLFEELSPELGVTEPVSGTVVFETQIN